MTDVIKKIFFVGIVVFFSALKLNAQIPVIGDTNTIEIGNWNLEWFGNTGYGPTDEPLQQNNVYDVIKTTDIDFWGLCEVSDSTAWKNLLSKLSGYSGVIATWSQTQKTALLYRNKYFKLLYSKSVLSNYYKEFASGRLPLEAAFETNFKNKKDTLIAFVLHMKANVGSDSQKNEAYQLRKGAELALKDYIDSKYSGKAYIILGDWNDDLDESIYNNLTTPYTAMLNDSNHYFFTTLRLTLSGKTSMASYNNVIDHQAISARMKYYYVQNSSAVIYMNNYISNYSTTTSDHYPVYSKYDLSRTVPSQSAGLPLIQNAPVGIVFLNNGILKMNNGETVKHSFIYDACGRQIEPSQISQGTIYFFRINTKEGNYYSGKFSVIQ